MSKLWGGRFEGSTHPEVERLTSSLESDQRLWECDLRASSAHAAMLGRQKIISPSDAAAIVSGLEGLAQDIKTGKVNWSSSGEDIHSELERLLTERTGPVAGKLHTARSRNDQVTTSTRLYLREQITEIERDLGLLQKWILNHAEQFKNAIMPGCTHLQHAQPVSLAHHLLAYFWMFERDRERFAQCRARFNELPLGSAALAGTSFPIDRESVARELGFAGVTQNSLDAVSDRDYVVEFLSSGALLMSHFSRLCEEIILWNTPEYGFVALGDAVTTGSSIMPQKKNPDVAELVRGRSGRLTGALMGILTVLKGLPLSYNRDLQEDKVHLFNGLDCVRGSITLIQLLLENTRFNTERMEQALAGDFSNATDLADHLVRQGVPFRQAHEQVGKTVRFCLDQGLRLENLSLDQIRVCCPEAGPEAVAILTHQSVMDARTSAGGTSVAAVEEQIRAASRVLSSHSN